MVTDREALLCLGGSWHDFEGFAEHLEPVIEQAGFAVRRSHDLNDLTMLETLGCRVVVLYTCLDERSPQTLTQTQTLSLTQWVDSGAGLLAIHATTVAARDDARLKSLLGAAFVSHPPKSTFRVSPTPQDHPIIRDLRAFDVDDELYLHDVDPGVHVLLTAEHAGRVTPLAWSRLQGLGRVVYFGLGHDQSAWDLVEYRNIVARSVVWLSQ